MAARRRPQEPAPIEVKQFLPEEIEPALARLQRRVAEVNELDLRKVRHDDQQVRNVEQNIRDTVLEIFGPNSPEYREHRFHRIWHGDMYAGMSNEEMQEPFAAGIPQTIKMLNNLIGRLEERRAEIAKDKGGRVRGAFENLDLHQRIATACADLYRDGHYSNAVLNASLALVNFVKEKSGRHDLDGSSLMQTVFSPNNPVLTFNALADQTDKDEQQGLMFLFSGAVLALRNPRAHRLLDDSPEEALEYIGLLSLLANRLEKAKRVK